VQPLNINGLSSNFLWYTFAYIWTDVGGVSIKNNNFVFHCHCKYIALYICIIYLYIFVYIYWYTFLYYMYMLQNDELILVWCGKIDVIDFCSSFNKIYMIGDNLHTVGYIKTYIENLYQKLILHTYFKNLYQELVVLKNTCSWYKFISS